ncbi:MAG: branched-chain amino acid ABC transporter substrate-binding protein [Anaerolineaceae bacterium]
MSKRFVLFFVVIVAMVLASCSPAASAAPTATAANSASSSPTSAPTASSGAPAACSTDSFGCAKIDPGQTIKIGMGAPMTGGNASYGIDISQGGMVATQDAGTLNGFKFELVAEDDNGDAEGGASVANKLVSDPTVVAIAGHIFSGATQAAIPIYEKAGLPMLSPSATNPALTTTGSKVFNRIAFTDSTQAKFAAAYLFNKLGVKNLAILHDGSDYGKGLAELVQTDFAALGGKVVIFQAITTGAGDFTNVLSAVASFKPEAVYFGGYVADASVLVNEMKTTGLEKAVFFGCDGTYGADFLTNTGANGEGAYAVTLTPPDSAVKAAFDQKYQTQFGKAPGVLSPYTWNGYDSVAALISVVKQVAVLGGDGSLYVPRGALVTAVRSLKDYQGLTGTFTRLPGLVGAG